MGYLVPIPGTELYLENTHKDSGRWKVPNISVRACVVVRSLVPRGGGALMLRGLRVVLKFYSKNPTSTEMGLSDHSSMLNTQMLEEGHCLFVPNCLASLGLK